MKLAEQLLNKLNEGLKDKEKVIKQFPKLWDKAYADDDFSTQDALLDELSDLGIMPFDDKSEMDALVAKHNMFDGVIDSFVVLKHNNWIFVDQEALLDFNKTINNSSKRRELSKFDEYLSSKNAKEVKPNWTEEDRSKLYVYEENGKKVYVRVGLYPQLKVTLPAFKKYKVDEDYSILPAFGNYFTSKKPTKFAYKKMTRAERKEKEMQDLLNSLKK